MAWLHLIIGVLLLTWGGDRLVSGATRIALAFNVSAMAIGLTVVAWGTSMPELVTSVLAAWAATPTLAVANILGSNIANLLLILAVGALISPMQVQSVTMSRDLPLLVAVTVGFAATYAEDFCGGAFPPPDSVPLSDPVLCIASTASELLAISFAKSLALIFSFFPSSPASFNILIVDTIIGVAAATAAAVTGSPSP